MKLSLNKNTDIDIEKLVASRLLIQANSGGGKSWTLRRLLEQSHGKLQHIIIDPEGEFSTLRDKYDYVYVGKGGDMEASTKSAALLARKLLEFNVSAIIDLYELHPQERKHFVKLFLDSMINSPKELHHPCLVVIDEAHTFAPEKGQSEALDAVIGLASLGRKRQFCAVLATQRISKLHKDVAAECNNKLIGRTGLDIDMKRAGEELGFTSKDQMLSLRSLEAGEFYAFGPAISKEVIKVEIGPVLTEPPRIGKAAGRGVAQPTQKIKSVLAKLGDLPAEAKKEQQTIADMQLEIRTLKAHRCPVGTTSQADIDRAVKIAVDKKEKEMFVERGEFLKHMNTLFKVIEGIGKMSADVLATKEIALEKLKKSGGDIVGTLGLGITGQTKPMPQQGLKPKETYFVGQDPAHGKDKSVTVMFKKEGDSMEMVSMTENKPVQGGAKRMLQVLVSRYPIALTKTQLGTFSKMKASGGSFGTYLSTLKGQGLIAQDGDLLQATEAGIEYLGESPQPPQTPDQVIAMWKDNLTGGAKRMFENLVAIYPQTLTKEELGLQSEVVHTGGSFGTYLSILKSNGLVDVRGSDVKLSDNLFI